jgi:hypothetical protein
LQNLAWALNRQAPRRITATLFVGLDTGKVVTQVDENNRKLRQIPVTAVLALYEKGGIILVERSVALNFKGDGFPDSLPGSAVVGIHPPTTGLSFVLPAIWRLYCTTRPMAPQQSRMTPQLNGNFRNRRSRN